VSADDEMVTWLRAQFDEDERVARGALRFSRDGYARGSYESWVAERKVNNATPPYYDHQVIRTERPATVHREIIRFEADLGGLVAEHIARFASPRRVLLDIRAKREMLDDIVAVPRFRREPMLKALALPYDDRPGYREEWRL
jgi:hypothetical protein